MPKRVRVKSYLAGSSGADDPESAGHFDHGLQVGVFLVTSPRPEQILCIWVSSGIIRSAGAMHSPPRGRWSPSSPSTLGKDDTSAGAPRVRSGRRLCFSRGRRPERPAEQKQAPGAFSAEQWIPEAKSISREPHSLRGPSDCEKEIQEVPGIGETVAETLADLPDGPVTRPEEKAARTPPHFIEDPPRTFDDLGSPAVGRA